jgi:hypothetical protein
VNPLASYLLSVLKNEKTDSTRKYLEHAESLSELGYWLLQRPAECPREKMPPCKISTECRLMDEFSSYEPSVFGGEGFAVMIDVYADEDAEALL